MKVDMSFLSEGKSGAWEVSHFKVSKEDAKWSMLRASICSGGARDYVPEGSYTYLKRNGSTIMSNTPSEMNDFAHFTRIAEGDILVNGLGLGCVIKVLLAKPEVKRIVVIEQSTDVIKLISPHFKDERLTIINADAYEYLPPKGEKYDYVWHDIWDNICSDNLPEMTKLHKKYARKTKWQDSWAKPECLYQKRKDSRYGFY